MFSRCVYVKHEARYKSVMSNDHVLEQMFDGDVSEDSFSLWKAVNILTLK